MKRIDFRHEGLWVGCLIGRGITAAEIDSRKIGICVKQGLRYDEITEHISTIQIKKEEK